MICDHCNYPTTQLQLLTPIYILCTAHIHPQLNSLNLAGAEQQLDLHSAIHHNKRSGISDVKQRNIIGECHMVYIVLVYRIQHCVYLR